MLTHDKASRALIGVTLFLTLFLYLQVGLEALITPIILLVCAVIFRVFVAVKKVQVDEDLTPVESLDVIYYGLISLLVLYVGDTLVNGLFLPPIPSAVLSVSSNIPFVAVTFLLLMAVSEEVLFRGELFNSIASNKRVMIGVAILISAGVFCFFHWKWYGTDPNDLLFVFMGGSTLSWSAWKTRRVLTPMVAHMIHNITGSQLFTPALIILVLLVLWLTYKKRWRQKTAWF